VTLVTLVRLVTHETPVTTVTFVTVETLVTLVTLVTFTLIWTVFGKMTHCALAKRTHRHANVVTVNPFMGTHPLITSSPT
jgi:hypothetical protein